MSNMLVNKYFKCWENKKKLILRYLLKCIEKPTIIKTIAIKKFSTSGKLVRGYYLLFFSKLTLKHYVKIPLSKYSRSYLELVLHFF